MVFDGTLIREYEERRQTEITYLIIQLKLEQVPILTPKTLIINPKIPLTHRSDQKNQSALSKPLQNTSAGAQLRRASRKAGRREVNTLLLASTLAPPLQGCVRFAHAQDPGQS